jgi:hypothetical protein
MTGIVKMICPLKGRFIYWGFVIPVVVKRRFKRRLSGVSAWNVVLNDISYYVQGLILDTFHLS